MSNRSLVDLTNSNPSPIFTSSRGSSNAPWWIVRSHFFETSITTGSSSAITMRLTLGCFSNSSDEPPSPPPITKIDSGIRVRQRGRVRHALVIEELISFGSHHASVKPKKLAELLCLVDLDFLIR